MAKNTGINNISNEIAKALSQYSEELEQGMLQARDQAAKNTVKILKNTSPELTGSYRKGWKVSTIDGKKVIHNKTDYQLTHLLEYGHANRDGGRTEAKIHIKPAEEAAVKEYLEATEKLIRGR